jgi:CRISPR-associated protein Cas5h
MKVLVFDISGKYAHYKKIYATTSAITYSIPTKTSLFGYLWAIGALKKNSDKNFYLKYFQSKSCLLGIQILNPIIHQRINTNLLSNITRKWEHKPTMVEYVSNPKFRIYVAHSDQSFFDNLKNNLSEGKSVYTPTFGTANLISVFSWVGEFETEIERRDYAVKIVSVIPKKKFIDFDVDFNNKYDFDIIEQSMFPIEMDPERNVIERDDILMERKAGIIKAEVTDFFVINGQNIILF